jgi:hypothetical protein
MVEYKYICLSSIYHTLLQDTWNETAELLPEHIFQQQHHHTVQYLVVSYRLTNKMHWLIYFFISFYDGSYVFRQNNAILRERLCSFLSHFSVSMVGDKSQDIWRNLHTGALYSELGRYTTKAIIHGIRIYLKNSVVCLNVRVRPDDGCFIGRNMSPF